MIKQNSLRMSVLFMLLVFVLSACQAGAPATTPTVESTRAPEATQIPEPTATFTPVPPTPTPVPEGFFSGKGTFKSGDGNSEVTLKFINKTGEMLLINWVNFNGVAEPFTQVEAGSEITQGTYSTHAWRLVDQASNTLADIVATGEKIQIFEIAADKNVSYHVPSGSELCKLPEAANLGDVGLGFPRYPSRMKSIGVVKGIVLFVDFSDAPATQTPEEVFAMVSPGASDYYKTVSYGQMDYQLQPHLVWLRMSKASTAYGWDNITYDLHRAYIQEAINLADPDVDFSGADAVYVMANPKATALFKGPAFSGAPQWGGLTADGVEIYNGATSGNDLLYWGFPWLNHEVGHTMGFADLYAFQGDTHRFVGDFSLMGNVGGTALEFLAYERWLLGWLDDEQIKCQLMGDEMTTLTAIEVAGGTKAIMVLTGPTSAVVVESRRALGYDAKLNKTGVLVYTIDTSIPSGEGPIKVLPDKDLAKLKSPLAAGETLTVGNVTITVISATDETDTVQVTVAK